MSNYTEQTSRFHSSRVGTTSSSLAMPVLKLVDKQGDIITRGALKDAFRKFMEDPKYRNVQLAHSNIQVGEVIPNYTDSRREVVEERSR